MSLPITNNFTTTNQYNNNLSAKGKPAIFLDFEVYATSPTSRVQEQAETPQTNVTDRSSTSSNNLNTIIIKPVNEFSDRNEMLNYFNEIMAFIYKSHNVELNPKFKIYIYQRKAIICNHITVYDCYKGLSNICKFIAEYLTNNNNDILDIMDALFPSYNKGRLNIRRKLMNYFISATDKQLKELAVNKNLYRDLLAGKQLHYIDLNNINHITNLKKAHDTKRESILRLIDKSTAVESKKSLIKGYTETLFDICLKKDIDIDPLLIKIIRYLLETPLTTTEEAKQILEKINLFFNYFDDDNNVIDTSILTKVHAYNYVPKVILLSVCNMTDEQIQFITSCKNRCKILQPWTSKGFPATKEIDKIIENHKKKNTANNSIKHVIIDSTSYSKPQSDSINSTKTEDSYYTIIALGQNLITNDDISKETPTFLNLDVSVINPTNSTKNQAETSQTPKTNVTDRSSTSSNNLNIITIKPVNEFRNKNKLLDYFNEIVDLIYKSYNVELNPKFKRYISQRKATIHNYITIYDYYKGLSNICKFIAVYLKNNNNEIFDIIDALLCNNLLIRQSLMDNFINLTDKQIQELAANKDLYRSLLSKHKLYNIDLNNIDNFTKSRMKHNKKQETKICSFIDKSSADKERKYLIQKHITDIFKICYKKDIDIDTNLAYIIKDLANSTQLTNADTKEILEKIIFFFNDFDDCNKIIDTSILTDIICYEKEKTNEQLLLSICNLNNEQIQFITSCKNRWKIMQPWIFKGFPATKEIDKIINHFKENHTNSNSTDVSAGYSNPQSDIINFTNTENSYPTAINFQDTDAALNSEQIAKFDDSIEQLDYKNNDMKQNEEEYDDLFAWLDANPNFLAEFNGATNSNPKLILPTKRPISPSLYSEEHNQNKISKLDFSFLD